MSSNICNRCKKNFKFPYLLKRHNERIFPCIERDSTKSSQNNPKIIPKSSQKFPKKNPKKKNPKNPVLENEKKYFCKFCEKKYKTKNGLYKHVNELRCTKIPNKERQIILVKKNNKEINKKIEISKIINNTLNNSNNTTNNNTINNNTTNNNTTNNNLTIKINPFGKENTSFLTKSQKIKILNKRYMGVPALIKAIHDRPENRNFYLKNINKKIIAYMDDDKELVFNDYDTICRKIVQNNIERIDDYFEEINGEIKENTKTRLLKILEESNTGELDEKYMNDIRFYIMNISKKNKQELNEFLDKIALQIKKSN